MTRIATGGTCLSASTIVSICRIEEYLGLEIVN